MRGPVFTRYSVSVGSRVHRMESNGHRVGGELPPIEIGGFLLHRPDSIPMPPRDGAPRSGRRVTEVLISIQACIRSVPALLFKGLFKMFKRVTQFIHPLKWVVFLLSCDKYE